MRSNDAALVVLNSTSSLAFLSANSENTAKTILLSLPLVVIVGHQQQASSSSFEQLHFVKHTFCLTKSMGDES